MNKRLVTLKPLVHIFATNRQKKRGAQKALNKRFLWLSSCGRSVDVSLPVKLEQIWDNIFLSHFSKGCLPVHAVYTKHWPPNKQKKKKANKTIMGSSLHRLHHVFSIRSSIHYLNPLFPFSVTGLIGVQTHHSLCEDWGIHGQIASPSQGILGQLYFKS